MFEVYSRSNIDGIWLVRVHLMIFQVSRIIETMFTGTKMNVRYIFLGTVPTLYLPFICGFLMQCCFLTAKLIIL